MCMFMFSESQSSPAESSTSGDDYSVLVKSLNLINDPNNMDENACSPMSNYTYLSNSMSPMSTASETSYCNYNLPPMNASDYNGK